MSQVWEQRREQADESLALTELPSSWGDRQVCAETSTRVCAGWTEQRDRGKHVGFSCLSSGRGLLCAGNTRLLGWCFQSLLRWPSHRSPRKHYCSPHYRGASAIAKWGHLLHGRRAAASWSSVCALSLPDPLRGLLSPRGFCR